MKDDLLIPREFDDSEEKQSYGTLNVDHWYSNPDYGHHGNKISLESIQDKNSNYVSKLHSTTIDDVYSNIGEFGRYQIYQYILLCLVSIVASFQAFNMVFIGDDPDYRCTVPVNASNYNMTEEELLNQTIPWEPCTGCSDYTTERSQCSMYNLTELGYELSDPMHWYRRQRTVAKQPVTTTECIYGYTYSKQYYESTIVTQWDLVCAQEWRRGIADTVFFSGRLLGALFFGPISDRFGRQIGLISAAVPQVLVGVLAACTQNYPTFLVLYFVQGATQVGIMLSSFVWATEIVGTSKRKVAAMGHKLSYSLGAMILAGIASGLRDWRFIELAVSLPSLFFIFYKCIMPESARWLLSNNKEEEARHVLHVTARRNGACAQASTCIDRLTNVHVARGDIRGLFKSFKLAKITLCLWLIWLVNQMVYSGLSLSSKLLEGDPYLNFFLVGIVEVPGIFLALALVDRTGRKPLVCAGLLVASVCCFAAGYIPLEYPIAAVAVCLAGKCAITHAFSVVFLITAEVFPTTFRNVGMGTTAMCGHLGGTLSAVFIALTTVYRPLPYILFGFFCLVGSVAIIFVPETLGKPLPQTLDEMEQSARLNIMSKLNPIQFYLTPHFKSRDMRDGYERIGE